MGRIAPTPPRRSPRTQVSKEGTSTGVVMRKPKVKTSFKTNTRNSLRTLTLGRSVAGIKRQRTNPATVFRSPSIYDEPRPVKKEEDTMTSFLSGKIVPLTPSSKPTNVDHLVKKVDSAEKKKEETKENIEEDVDGIKTYPIALHDGILNSRKNFCNIS